MSAEGRVAVRIDFNCDMGEGFGPYVIGQDRDILPYVTSANIACGFHAGDPATMRRTVAMAEARGVGVGAHPGFPDLRGFGRRALDATPADIRDDIIYQMGALSAFTRGKRLQHVKPHGALSNMAVAREDCARAIVDALLEADPDVVLVALAGSAWATMAEAAGLRVAREVFADRACHADGTLVARSVPGAVIHDLDRVIERSLRLAVDHEAVAVTGEVIRLDADTICLHGDTPGAVTLAAALHAAFLAAGVELVPMATVLAR